MERFIDQEENFVSDARFNCEPVKVDESGGDVLPGLGAGEDPGSRVLILTLFLYCAVLMTHSFSPPLYNKLLCLLRSV